jgi:hypothetical protein
MTDARLSDDGRFLTATYNRGQMATVSIRKLSAALDPEARQAWTRRIQRDFEGQSGVAQAVAILNQHKEMTVDVSFRQAVIEVLTLAGIPAAKFGEDEEGMPVCERAGFLLGGGPRAVTVAIIGYSGASESVRQAERDGMIQQARSALDAAGYQVRVNEYGRLTLIPPSPAS